MKAKIPGAAVGGRQRPHEPLADLVEVAGAGIVDLTVLLEDLLRGLIADLLLVGRAGLREQPAASAGNASRAGAIATPAPASAASRRNRRRDGFDWS